MGGAITLRGCFASSLAGALWAIASLEDCALAQIIPDSTLGNENSTVTSTGTVDQINGGVTKGTNLFHSFQEFNIGNGRSAFFSNPPGIENILSRVTGANPSNILGTLGVSGGNANLFLINPNGIIFGQNARLDVGGSFVATTANAIGLANGDIFSANPVEPLPNQLLNVNPNAFFFNQVAAQPIINRSTANSTGLQVPQGQSLLLVGGEVKLEGGISQAPGGQVELGGLAGAGTVGLSIDGNNLRLNFPDGVTRADVSLTDRAGVNVAAGGGGSIAVNARNLEISGGSRLFAGIDDVLGSVGAIAGNIDINATEQVTIAGTSPTGSSSRIVNEVGVGAIGNSGDINIQARSVSVTNGAHLSASTFGQGNAGSVTIRATDTVSFDGGDAFSTVEEEAVGNSGGINITTKSLSVTNGAALQTLTRGKGDAGSMTIRATDTVSFDGVGSNGFNSVAVSQVESGAVGNGGSIDIITGSLSVTNGAVLAASTLGRGDAGSVTIRATDTVSFDGVGSNGRSSTAFSSVGSEAVGNGGGIDITTGSLSVTNRAQLAASTSGQGDAGSVTIRATDTVSFDGESAAFSTVEEGAVGNGNGITITTRSLSVRNGAQLEAQTSGRGDAGSVTIRATDTVSFDGVSSNGLSSTAFSWVEAGAVGNGGDINITTGSLSVTNGALLFASTYGQGNAGSVTINASDTVSFDGVGSNGFLSAATSEVGDEGVGKGGGINITARSLSVTNGAGLSSSSGRSGNAGELRVEASSIFLNNQGKLQASTASGEGGNISLQVQDLILMRRNSLISARADNNGNGGNITINAPFVVAIPSENSDIVANAFRGRGGNINITTQGIYGLEYRQELTAESDINASSEFGVDGTVEINSPDVDPSRGLVNLPAVPIDTEVAQGCSPGGSQSQSEFVVTGRGGLPPNPGEALNTDAVQVDLMTLNPEVDKPSTPAVSTSPTSSAPAQLVEAQGWVIDANGKVVLTANAPTVTPHSSWHRTADCQKLN
jgi:filamentous hemagglutinin family protein